MKTKKILLLLCILAFEINFNYSQHIADWLTSYSNTGGTHDVGLDVHILYKDGSIIAYGADWDDALGDYKAECIKINASDGALEWVSTIDSTNSQFTNAVIDAYGNFYGIYQDYDVYQYNRLCKINTSGLLLWDIPIDSMSESNCITLDNSGNIIVGGYTPIAYAYSKARINKYDPSGTLLWKKSVGPNDGNSNYIKNIVTDNSGNIYGVGVHGGLLDGLLVVKLSTTGSSLWEYTENIPAWTYYNMQIQLDGSNHVYTCLFGNEYNGQKLVYKFTEDGLLNWSITVTHDFGDVNLIGTNFQVDSEGNVYLGGDFVEKYNSSGILVWQFSNPTFLNSSNSKIILTDGGNLYFGGTDASYGAGGAGINTYLYTVNPENGETLFAKNISNQNSIFYPYPGYIITGGEHGDFIVGENEDIYCVSPTLQNSEGLPLWNYFSVGKYTTCEEMAITCPTAASISSTPQVSGPSCVNGNISFTFTSPFNFNIYVELYDYNNTLVQVIEEVKDAPSISFTNLYAGRYHVNIYDESCCVQTFSNIVISCSKPTSGFATSNITSSSAKVKWDASACGEGYKIQYRPTGTATWLKKSTGTNSKKLTGLLPNTTYEWKVSTQCLNSDPDLYSSYSSLHYFTTLPLREGDTSIVTELYPNPTGGEFTLVTPFVAGEIVTVRITDITGRGVKYLEYNSSVDPENIDLNMEPPGIYLITVAIGKVVQTYQLVKE